MRLERIGLVVNPRAGEGGERNRTVTAAVLAALAPVEVIAGSVEPDVESSRAITQRVARESANQGADALVIVGGDGTMADAATVLHDVGSRVPILGVGAGSTNAGALVSIEHTRVNELVGAVLEVRPVAALELRLPDGAKSLAFNDVVIGTTICGTAGGKYVNLAAEPFMRGQAHIAVPEPVRSATATVTKSQRGGTELSVAEGEGVGSVVIGFTRIGDVRGQALLGGLGLSSAAGVPAGCLVASFPLVFAELGPKEHAEFEPLRSAYVGLSEGEHIRLGGLGGGAVLCADGNPLHLLRPEDQAEIAFIADASQVVTLAGTPW